LESLIGVFVGETVRTYLVLIEFVTLGLLGAEAENFLFLSRSLVICKRGKLIILSA
jgi:hypothetical protein